MQLGFFIQQSAYRVLLRANLGSDSCIFVNSIGVHVGALPIYCLVCLFRRLGLQKFISYFFFIEALAYQMCTLEHTLYQFYGIKWMIFHE